MIKLGRLNIKGYLVLAPLAGYTDSPFRKIARRHGASLVFTELISADGIVRSNRKTHELLRFSDEERPLGIQIFGKDPSIMADAAGIIEEMEPDLIDINYGCCAPKVCNGGSGASLLKEPELLEAIASSIVNRVNVPVSAKIRLGWDLSSKNYSETVKRLEGAGVSMISVHGRTRSERFGNSADWSSITEIAATASVPIIGNGDISSYPEALSQLKDSGCAAVMIGRRAIGNPWIFSGMTPNLFQIVEQMKEHLGLMVNHYGEYGIILMRKHIVKYIHGIPNAASIRGKIMNSKSYSEVVSLLNDMSVSA